jgi:hypothetical protein
MKNPFENPNEFSKKHMQAIADKTNLNLDIVQKVLIEHFNFSIGEKMSNIVGLSSLPNAMESQK